MTPPPQDPSERPRSNTERVAGEPLLDYIGRNVRELRFDVRDLGEKLDAHVRADLEAHSGQDLEALSVRKDLEAQARRVLSLEDAAEVTGVHNTEELKGKYYDQRRALESLQALHRKVIFGTMTAVAGAVITALGKKLGWL